MCLWVTLALVTSASGRQVTPNARHFIWLAGRPAEVTRDGGDPQMLPTGCIPSDLEGDVEDPAFRGRGTLRQQQHQRLERVAGAPVH